MYNLSESVYGKNEAINSLNDTQPYILTAKLVQQEERSSLVIPPPL